MAFTWRRVGKRHIADESSAVFIRKEQNSYIAHRVLDDIITEYTCASLAEAKAYCERHIMVYRLVPNSSCRFVASFINAVEAELFCRQKNLRQRAKKLAPEYFYQAS